MSQHPNMVIARQMLEAFNAGRADLITDMYADDGVMHIAGKSRISGTFRGHAEIANGLNNQFQVFASGTVQVEVPPESILTSDDHTMIFFRARAEHDGNMSVGTVVIAATVDPNGKYKTVWFLTDDQALLDRFWS